MSSIKTIHFFSAILFSMVFAVTFSAIAKGNVTPCQDNSVSNRTDGDEAKNKKSDSVEVTEVDFAKAGKFNGSHATVFSIALGDGKNAVKEKIKNYTFLSLKEDAFTPKRYYLVDESSKTNVAYLIWPNYDSGLYQIVIYPAMAKYMKGLSAAIVSPECVNKESDVYTSFLGEPSARQVSLDNPKIEMKTTLLYYPKWNIVIEESKTSSGTQYNLMFTHKWK